MLILVRWEKRDYFIMDWLKNPISTLFLRDDIIQNYDKVFKASKVLTCGLISELNITEKYKYNFNCKSVQLVIHFLYLKIV